MVEHCDLSPDIGVEVLRLDLRESVAEADRQRLRELFDDRHLLVFRGQELTIEQQVAAVSLFGPVIDEMEDGTYASFVSNVDPEAFIGDSDKILYHADYTFTPMPFMGLSLYAVEASDDAPPTRYVSLEDGLNRLPEALADRLGSMRAMDMVDFGGPDSTPEREPIRFVAPADAASNPARYPTFEHPVVMPHPRTKAPLLCLSDHFTERLLDIDKAAGNALIDAAFKELYRSEFTYAHDWKPGDLVIWDNIALQHGRDPIPEGARRTLRRVSMSQHSLSDVLASVSSGKSAINEAGWDE